MALCFLRDPSHSSPPTPLYRDLSAAFSAASAGTSRGYSSMLAVLVTPVSRASRACRAGRRCGLPLNAVRLVFRERITGLCQHHLFPAGAPLIARPPALVWLSALGETSVRHRLDDCVPSDAHDNGIADGASRRTAVDGRGKGVTVRRGTANRHLGDQLCRHGVRVPTQHAGKIAAFLCHTRRNCYGVGGGKASTLS